MRSEGEGEGEAGTDGRGGVWWGLMEGRECWGWGMSLCMRGEPPRPLASRDGVPLSSCVDSSSRVACSLCVASLMRVAFSSRVASLSPVASCIASLRMSLVFTSCCCCTLSVGGGAGRLRLLVVLGPRCHPWGGLLTIPQRPCEVRGVGACLVCYLMCTVVLGLQTRLVKGGAMTMGWPLTFPTHIMYVAWALRLFAVLLAPSSVALRGVVMRGVDSGRHHRQHCGTLAVVKSRWWWWWRKGNKWSRKCDYPTKSRHGNI